MFAMYPYVAKMKKPLKNNNFLILEQGAIGPHSSSIK